MKRVLAILLLVTLFSLPAVAQNSTSGKNKVQYEKFAWIVRSVLGDIHRPPASGPGAGQMFVL